jgi:uncharacterized protein YicC (UPF0701 family)
LKPSTERKLNGRKLPSPEMGREINTMGSKSNHAQMQKLVVQMKDELKKSRKTIINSVLTSV